MTKNRAVVRKGVEVEMAESEWQVAGGDSVCRRNGRGRNGARNKRCLGAVNWLKNGMRDRNREQRRLHIPHFHFPCLH